MADKIKQTMRWVKLFLNIFDYQELNDLVHEMGGLTSVIVYIILALMTANTDGVLCVNYGNEKRMTTPIDVQLFCRHWVSREEIEAAVMLLLKHNLIFERQDGYLAMTGLGDVKDQNEPDLHMLGNSEPASSSPVHTGKTEQDTLRRKERKRLQAQSNNLLLTDSNGVQTKYMTYSEMRIKAGLQSRNGIPKRVKKLNLESFTIQLGREKALPIELAEKVINFEVTEVTIGDNQSSPGDSQVTVRLQSGDSLSSPEGTKNVVNTGTGDDRKKSDKNNKNNKSLDNNVYTQVNSEEIYKLSPDNYLEILQHGVKVTNTDKRILDSLAEMGFNNEVTNTMLEYILNESDNRLIPKFVDMVGGEWARAGIKSREEALVYIEDSKKKKTSKRSTNKNRRGNVVIDAPDYIVQQMDGTLPEETKASDEQIAQIKALQEKMSDI